MPFSKLKVISTEINLYDYTATLFKKELDLNKLFGVHENEFYLKLLLDKLEVSLSVKSIDNNGKVKYYLYSDRLSQSNIYDLLIDIDYIFTKYNIKIW